MLEENKRKKLGLAKMLLQQNTKETKPVSTPVQTDLFDLKNFRKGLRDTLVGRRTMTRSEEERQ